MYSIILTSFLQPLVAQNEQFHAQVDGKSVANLRNDDVKERFTIGDHKVGCSGCENGNQGCCLLFIFGSSTICQISDDLKSAKYDATSSVAV